MNRVAVTFAVSVALVGAAIAQQATPHAPDGTTFERLQSISVPPKPNAPFSAVVNTEWTRIFEDGSSRTLKNRRQVARDSVGRVFQQRTFLAADGNPGQSRVTSIEISDPQQHTTASCDSLGQVCRLNFYRGGGVGIAASPAPNVKSESLGTIAMNGLEVVGTRETQTLNQLLLGTDRPLVITREFWYSGQLGLNVVTKRNDPRSGSETFTVSDITLGDPDPTLFALPKTARVIDLRPSR
jgi:hypothetical protein